MLASFSIVGMLTMTPQSPDWWNSHYRIMMGATECIAVIPFLLLLGFIFGKLFARSPAAHAFASMVTTIAIIFVVTLPDPGAVLIMFRAGPEFFVAFLMGTPVATFLIERVRSRRLERLERNQ